MHKGYVHFVREIYSYCDKNIGKKVLFPFFVNLWNGNGDADYLSKRDLSRLASKVVFRLLEKKVLEEIPKDDKSQTPYGLYNVLPHQNLIRCDEFAQKRSKLVL